MSSRGESNGETSWKIERYPPDAPTLDELEPGDEIRCEHVAHPRRVDLEEFHKRGAIDADDWREYVRDKNGEKAPRYHLVSLGHAPATPGGEVVSALKYDAISDSFAHVRRPLEPWDGEIDVPCQLVAKGDSVSFDVRIDRDVLERVVEDHYPGESVDVIEEEIRQSYNEWATDHLFHDRPGAIRDDIYNMTFNPDDCSLSVSTDIGGEFEDAAVAAAAERFDVTFDVRLE